MGDTSGLETPKRSLLRRGSPKICGIVRIGNYIVESHRFFFIAAGASKKEDMSLGG